MGSNIFDLTANIKQVLWVLEELVWLAVVWQAHRWGFFQVGFFLPNWMFRPEKDEIMVNLKFAFQFMIIIFYDV